MADDPTVSVAAEDKDSAASASAASNSVEGAAPASVVAEAAAASSSASSSSSSSSSNAKDVKDVKSSGEGDGDATDAEIEAMKKRVKEMEDEAKKIEDMQNSVEKSLKPKPQAAAPSGPDVDARSVYVGNVDYSTTPEELQEFFASCGVVNRITILCDKFTGHPKGYAYVEFKDVDSVQNALLLNDSEFKGRPLKVTAKRTNVPGMTEFRGSRRPRGRGAPRGGYRPPRGPPAYNSYPSYGAAPRARFRHRRFTSPYAR